MLTIRVYSNISGRSKRYPMKTDRGAIDAAVSRMPAETILVTPNRPFYDRVYLNATVLEEELGNLALPITPVYYQGAGRGGGGY